MKDKKHSVRKERLRKKSLEVSKKLRDSGYETFLEDTYNQLINLFDKVKKELSKVTPNVRYSDNDIQILLNAYNSKKVKRKEINE